MDTFFFANLRLISIRLDWSKKKKKVNHFTCGLGVGWGAVDGEGWGSVEHFLANLATILIGLDLLVDNNLKKTLDHFSYGLGGRWMGRDGEWFFSILSSILIGLDCLVDN